MTHPLEPRHELPVLLPEPLGDVDARPRGGALGARGSQRSEGVQDHGHVDEFLDEGAGDRREEAMLAAVLLLTGLGQMEPGNGQTWAWAAVSALLALDVPDFERRFRRAVDQVVAIKKDIYVMPRAEQIPRWEKVAVEGNLQLKEEALTQLVFLKAWQAIPRYEQRNVPFKSWLYRMAHNQMVDHFRTRRVTVDLDGIDRAEPPEAEDAVIAGELRAHLERALRRLSGDHCEVLVLRFLMEKSAAEIGEIMGRKEVTVRGLQLRALRALRRELEAMGGEL